MSKYSIHCGWTRWDIEADNDDEAIKEALKTLDKLVTLEISGKRLNCTEIIKRGEDIDKRSPHKCPVGKEK